MRLAFSVAVNVDPDILIIDEVLGVGDQAFFKKCFDRIMEFRRSGKTILCVPHSLRQLEQLSKPAVSSARPRAPDGDSASLQS